MTTFRPRGVFDDDFGTGYRFAGDPRLAEIRAALRVGEAQRALQLASTSPLIADPDLDVLLACYRNAARAADVNWFPDRLGASGADGGPPFAEFPTFEEVGVASAPWVALERMILDFEMNMRSIRTSASIAARFGNMNGLNPMAVGIESIASFDQLAASMGHVPTRAWLARQASGLAAIRWDASAQQLSAQAWAHVAPGDREAHAVTSLQMGDQVFGRPEAMGWNLTSSEVEQLPTRAMVDLARSHWHEADQSFEAIGSDWGVALVGQREGVGLFAVGAYDEASACFSAAARALSIAGDEARCRLARAQQIVCDVIRGVPVPTASATLADIVVWANTVGSRSWVGGIGLILVNAARSCGMQGRAESALQLLNLARDVLDGVGFTRDRTQLLLDRARIAAALGNRAVVSSDLEAAFDLVVNEAEQAEGDFMRAMRAVQIAGQVFASRVSEMDPEAIRARALRMQAVAERMLAMRDSTGLPPDAPIPDQLEPGMSMEAMLAFGFQLVGRQAQWATDQANVLSTLYQAVRQRDDGADDAAELFAQAMDLAVAAEHDAEAAGSRADASVLQLTVLGQQGRFAEARQRFEADVAAQMPNPRMRLEMAAAISSWQIAAQSAAEHAKLAGERWWERELNPWEGPTLLAEIAAGQDDPVLAVEWAELASSLFEQRSRRLASAVHRTSLADSPMVRRLHMIGARCSGDLSALAVQHGEHALADAWLERALGFAERGRSRALADLLVTTRDPRFAGAEVRRWLEAQAAASSAEAQLADAWRAETPAPDRSRLEAANDAAAQALVDAEAALQDHQPLVLEALRDLRSAPLTLADLRKRLDDTTVLIEYVLDGVEVRVGCRDAGRRPATSAICWRGSCAPAGQRWLASTLRPTTSPLQRPRS
jgi:tetratricopeptide (TPR) repeat protein